MPIPPLTQGEIELLHYSIDRDLHRLELLFILQPSLVAALRLLLQEAADRTHPHRYLP